MPRRRRGLLNASGSPSHVVDPFFSISPCTQKRVGCSTRQASKRRAHAQGFERRWKCAEADRSAMGWVWDYGIHVLVKQNVMENAVNGKDAFLHHACTQPLAPPTQQVQRGAFRCPEGWLAVLYLKQ